MKVNKRRIHEKELQQQEKLQKDVVDEQLSAPNTPQNVMKMVNKGKPSGGKIAAIIGGSFAGLILLVFVVMGILGSVKQGNPTGEQEPEQVVDNVEPNDEDIGEVIDTEVDGVDTPDDNTPDDNTPEPVVESYDYDNLLMGIAFNYSDDLYIQENTVDMFNILSKYAEENESFRLDRDKLGELVTLAKFTTGGTNNYYITLNVVPFTLTSEVEVGEGKEKEKVALETLIDEDMLKTYDESIRKSLEEKNCVLDTMDTSYIKEINAGLGIVSARKYTNSAENGGIYVDILQCMIPIGDNAILISSITDGNPTGVNRQEQFEEIINSLVIKTVEDETETESKEDTDSKENPVGTKESNDKKKSSDKTKEPSDKKKSSSKTKDNK